MTDTKQWIIFTLVMSVLIPIGVYVDKLMGW